MLLVSADNGLLVVALSLVLVVVHTSYMLHGTAKVLSNHSHRVFRLKLHCSIRGISASDGMSIEDVALAEDLALYACDSQAQRLTAVRWVASIFRWGFCSFFFHCTNFEIVMIICKIGSELSKNSLNYNNIGRNLDQE
jgi:hypothetical protein